MQNRFQVLPRDMLCYFFLFLPDDLITIQFVAKKWKLIADELLYKPDLITSLCDNLSPERVKDIITAYKETTAYQLLSAISSEKRNAWQTLTCIIAEGTTDQLDLLAKAFFTIASRLPVVWLGKFITNFRTTLACKALLDLPDNLTSHLQKLCQAMLCDNVMKIKSSLAVAIEWARNHFTGKEYKQLLCGLQVTLFVNIGLKSIPHKPDYYINLRGANLMSANLIDRDFTSGYVDLSGSDLSFAKFSYDKSFSRVVCANFCIYAFSYIRDNLIDTSRIPLPARAILGIIVDMLYIRYLYQSNFTEHSKLGCVDLRNADLFCVSIGGCQFDGAQMTKSKMRLVKGICEAGMTDATLIDESCADNLNEMLTELIDLSHVQPIRNTVTDNLISLSQAMPAEKAVPLLQNAITHPFFTKKLPSIKDWMYAALPITSYVQSFFRRGPDPLERLKNALANLQTQPEYKVTDRGLKRKFSVI